MKTRLQSLPPPSDHERAHAARVASHIAGIARAAGGRLAFDRFMDLALYAPGLGYYATGEAPFGPAGDFVTAPSLGSVFGACLARPVAEVLDTTGGAVLEFGAGSGVLCRQLMEQLDALGRLPERYLVLETSAALRSSQMDEVARLPAALARRVEWLDRLPAAPFTGVVVANEVLDAMPVTRFTVTGDGVAVDGVTVRGDDFDWCTVDATSGDGSLDALAARHALPPGYRSEVCPRASAWVASMGEWLGRGAAFVIDYGYPAAEYYHPERGRGTLQCFFHHVAHDDPLVLTGIQDITAHVDFSAVARAARDAGLDLLGFASQGSFLLGAGLMEVIGAGADDAAGQLALANEVKRLTLPTEMGELVKVLAIGRGLGRAPGAFDGIDRSGVLAS